MFTWRWLIHCALSLHQRTIYPTFTLKVGRPIAWGVFKSPVMHENDDSLYGQNKLNHLAQGKNKSQVIFFMYKLVKNEIFTQFLITGTISNHCWPSVSVSKQLLTDVLPSTLIKGEEWEAWRQMPVNHPSLKLLNDFYFQTYVKASLDPKWFNITLHVLIYFFKK